MRTLAFLMFLAGGSLAAGATEPPATRPPATEPETPSSPQEAAAQAAALAPENHFLPLARVTWTRFKGAAAPGRPKISTIERTVEAGLLWGSRERGRWGASVQVQDRADSGLNPLPGTGTPVGGLHGLGLRAFHTRELARRRRFQGFFSLRGAAEDPGEVNEALSGLLAFGWDRPTSRYLRFGLGLVVVHTPDRGTRVFPTPSLTWDPPGPLSASIGGPQAGIRYDLSKRWQLAFSAGLQLRRYHLKSGQTFADEQVPVRLGLRRQVQGQTAFEVFVGKLLNRTWRVEGPVVPGGGALPAELDVDGGSFIGFQASIPLGRLPRKRRPRDERTP